MKLNQRHKYTVNKDYVTQGKPMLTPQIRFIKADIDQKNQRRITRCRRWISANTRFERLYYRTQNQI